MEQNLLILPFGEKYWKQDFVGKQWSFPWKFLIAILSFWWKQGIFSAWFRCASTWCSRAVSTLVIVLAEWNLKYFFSKHNLKLHHFLATENLFQLLALFNRMIFSYVCMDFLLTIILFCSHISSCFLLRSWRTTCQDIISLWLCQRPKFRPQQNNWAISIALFLPPFFFSVLGCGCVAGKMKIINQYRKKGYRSSLRQFVSSDLENSTDYKLQPICSAILPNRKWAFLEIRSLWWANCLVTSSTKIPDQSVQRYSPALHKGSIMIELY